MRNVQFVSYPLPPPDPALDCIPAALDPVLTPLGFQPGQIGEHGGRGQVIFCRGFVEGIDDGCVDLVVDVEAAPDWRITDVRYWGFPSDRWHLPFERESDLAEQISCLARTLPDAIT